MKAAFLILAVISVLIGFGFHPSDYHVKPKCADSHYVGGVSPSEITIFDSDDSSVNEHNAPKTNQQVSNEIACSDLVAQWVVADTTERMFWFSIAGMALILATLMETQVAGKLLSNQNEMALSATKAEFQPYISFPRDIRITLSSIKSANGIFTIRAFIDKISIINKGQTPANNMIVWVSAELNYDTFGKFNVKAEPFKIIGDVLVNDPQSLGFEIVTGAVPDVIGQNYTTNDLVIKIHVVFDDMFSSKRTYLAVYKKNLPVNQGYLQSVEEIKQT